MIGSFGRSMPGELYRQWPRDEKGEPVPPKFLAHCTSRDVEDVMLAKLAAKNPALAEMNKKALELGFAWGEDPDHVTELEEKEVSDSKYSLEKTTVGQLLDTPELRAIVERIAPQILEHPLIEAGRMFKIADALPYMKDMITAEQLEQFRNELEKIE